MKSSKGFTLVELLVVIAVISVLAGLLVPAVSEMREKADRSFCGNNQKQIMTMLAAYHIDFRQGWPWAAASEEIPLATVDNLSVFTVASLMHLAQTYSNEMPNKTFICPSSGRNIDGQATTNLWRGAQPLSVDENNFSNIPWGIASNTESSLGYAFDWTCSYNSGATNRVVMADRTPSNHLRSAVIAVYRDTHWSRLDVNRDDNFQPVASGHDNITDNYSLEDNAKEDIYVENEEIPEPDNIYSNQDDIGNGFSNIVERGSRRFTWLR